MLRYKLINEILKLFHDVLIANIKNLIKTLFRLTNKIFVVIEIRHDKKRKYIII